MIGKLSGKIDSVFADKVILEVHGVGYIVYVSKQQISVLAVGDIISLYVETLIRQDNIQLCGFKSIEEKECFQKLISVQGVGGKAALAILSVLSPSELILAIQQQNKELLTRADGIGPKVASRLLTELKSFASKQLFEAGGHPISYVLDTDAIDTLVQLGYRQSDATNAVRKILAEMPTLSTQEIIPKALGYLARGISS